MKDIEAVAEIQRSLYRVANELYDSTINQSIEQLESEDRVPAVKTREAAMRHLDSGIDKLLRSSIEQAGKVSSGQWLAYLRTVPRGMIFPTTDGYDRIRESIEHISSKYAAPPRLNELPLFADDGVSRRVVRFVATVRLLEEYRNVKRHCILGATPLIRRHTLPSMEVPNELQKSLDIFNYRLFRDSWDYSTTVVGTRLSEISQTMNDDNDILCAIPLRGWRHMQDYAALISEEQDAGSIPSQFAPGWLNLHSLTPKTRALYAGISGEEHMRLVATLLWMREFTMDAVVYYREGFTMLSQFGFVAKTFEDLPRFYSRARANCGQWVADRVPGDATYTDDELTNALLNSHSLHGSVYGGSILRAERKFCIFDFSAATLRLSQMQVTATGGGEASNERASHFEDIVQYEIDQTKWRPGASARAMRGKNLKFDGQSRTDIDAIAENGNALILVDAKSYPRSALYDSGDPSAPWNRSRDIERAVGAWKAKIDFFRKNPVGDNYDFRNWKKLFGVVCIPGPLWVPIGIATQDVRRGIKAACTLGELRKHLDK